VRQADENSPSVVALNAEHEGHRHD
jgi:hypothetical protein